MAQVRTTAKVIIRDHGWKQIKINARGLNGQGVNAGILAADAGRRGRSRDWSGNPIPGTARVVDYATWNEYGVNSAHVRIPSRPFMRHTFDTNTAEIAQRCASAADAALVFGKATVIDPLQNLGWWYVNLIRKTLDTAERWARPLSPVTVAKKGHDLPLIDFGTLRSVISFAVARRKKP